MILDYPRYLLLEKQMPLSGEGLLFRILHHAAPGISLPRLAMISQELYRNVRHRRKAPQSLRDYLRQLQISNEGRLFPLEETDAPLMDIASSIARLEQELESLSLAAWYERLLSEARLGIAEQSAFNELLAQVSASDPGLDHPDLLLRIEQAWPSAADEPTIKRPGLPKPDTAFLESLLKGFKLSVSALNNFLRCPLVFYYESLLRAPGGSSEAAQYGTSIHDAVDRYYTKMMTEERSYPPPEALIHFFQEDMERNKHCFLPERLTHYLEKGENGLRAFHAAFIEGRGDEFIRTEVRLEATVDGVPLKGFIDKMQYHDGEVRITDFKTGSLKRCDHRLDFVPAGHPDRQAGGNYWRQAVVYKLLFDRQKNNHRELEAIEFLFIEPNEEGNFDRRLVHVSPEDEEVVRRQLTNTWTRIQEQDFFNGCGKANCDWCKLVRLRED